MAKIINTAKIYKPGGTSSGGGGPTLPAGSDGEIQWNNAGAFGASSDLYWDKINNWLSVGHGLSPGARVHVRSQGNLSTDRALRVDDTTATERFSVRGDGSVYSICSNSSINIGFNTTANTNSVVFGLNTTANGNNSIGIGSSSTANGNNSLAVGFFSSANSGSCVAVGFSSTASGISSVAVGNNVFATGPDSVAVGTSLTAAGLDSVAFGYNLTANGTNSVAIGSSSATNDNNSIAVGISVSTSENNNTAVGRSLLVNNPNCAVFGSMINLANSPNNNFIVGFGCNNTIRPPKLCFKSDTFNQLLLGYAPEEANYSSNAGTNWFAIANGTPPAGQFDAFQLYSADITPGNAAPHFRTEAGQVIRLYRETTAVTPATFVANTGTAVNDNSTFAGYTIAQVVQALRNIGILA